MSLTDFFTTIDRVELLARLERELAELRVKRAAEIARNRKKHAAFARKLVVELRATLRGIESGKILPNVERDRNWCDVYRDFCAKVGNGPDIESEYRDRIARFESAIFQIRSYKRDAVQVTTTQLREWLGGDRSRRGSQGRRR